MRGRLVWFRLGDPTSFPVISRLRRFFPLFGGRKFPFAMPATCGVDYPNHLIARRFDGDPDRVLRPDAIFCGNFPVEPGNFADARSYDIAA
jgi:hypothetical protein